MRPIDGDALLSEYDRVHEGPPGKARKLIEEALTIYRTMTWIPCSKMLPSTGQVVLWCNEFGSVFTSAITVKNSHSWAIGKRHRGPKIIAWMPLPDPCSENLDPITVRDKLNSMTDDEFAEWLCHQIFPDYEEDDVINVMRYQSVRNYLKMDIKQTKEGTICRVLAEVCGGGCK